MPKPDIKTFLNDPKHADDKVFMQSLFDVWFEERVKKEKEAQENGEENLFDFLFDFNKK